ncbi:MAG: argininosuccinate lyase [Candidatus Omnitrophota bacterium]|nr:argininosuccinate lyase [Candidatus Omnitrophota bacterium]
MSKKLWGGRFKKKTDPSVEKFTKSIHYDYKLAKYDILGSMAHVAILGRAGYLTSGEVVKMQSALAGIANGKFSPDDSYEDVHSQIQGMLQREAGDLALKLHTARSRNDQVVFATKVYCKAQLAQLEQLLGGLIAALNGLAKANKDVIVPGFTHMQHAQPVYLKDYIGAYVIMLEGDLMKAKSAASDLKLTLGAGAIAGTPIAADRYNISLDAYAKKIKIPLSGLKIAPTRNSVYDVSERGFVAEALNVTAIIAAHLSRFAEDMIIWSTKEFDFVDIDESFCTGSSLMPQKKNPDVLELIRGYAGRMYGNRIGFLAVIKGLPLSYNRDMQLDKEPLFDSFEVISGELAVLTGLVKTLKFNKVKIEEHLEDESLYATDLVYYLVDKGVAFKEAHTIIGKLVKRSIDSSIEIKSMTDNELKKFSDKLARKDIIKLLNPKVSVESKKSIKRER